MSKEGGGGGRGEKNVKVGGLGGGLLMVACYAFIFVSNLLTTLFVFNIGFWGGEISFC